MSQANPKAEEHRPNDILDTPAAASYLKLAPVTLERMRIKGDGPVFAKMRKSVRYRRCDLDAYIESRTTHSTSEKVERQP